MSRTFRRKGDKKRNKSGRAHFERNYTHDYPQDDSFLLIKWGGQRLVPLEGKQFWKGYWTFHADTNNSYGWSNPVGVRRRFEVVCRMKNKQELNRYIKNNEYEVMTHKPECLSWER